MNKRATILHAVVAVLVLLFVAPPAHSQTTAPLTVTGSRAEALLELPGGLAIDLAITFEQVVGLNGAALDVSASFVSPGDLTILTRMPSPDTIIPAALPVLIRIEPSAASALSFAGVVSINLHTHSLSLDLSAPLVLFSASNGGAFRDITSQVAVGSYRVAGSGGGFSEFIIARDPRPLATIISEKFDHLDAHLSAHEAVIPPAVLTALRGHVNEARTLFSGGFTVQAISRVADFIELVKAQGGVIPDVWRAHDVRTNVAGVLRSAAQTLQFSLTLKSNQP
jgi:hypothetical protein